MVGRRVGLVWLSNFAFLKGGKAEEDRSETWPGSESEKVDERARPGDGEVVMVLAGKAEGLRLIFALLEGDEEGGER